MLLLLIFPILISGFLVFTNHPSYFYKLHRFEGQLLYLKSAYLGSTCAVIAFFLTIVVYLISSLHPSLNVIKVFEFVLAYADINATSHVFIFAYTLNIFFVAFAWSKGSIYLAKFRFRHYSGPMSASERYKQYLMASILEDSPLDELFLSSYRRGDVLMLHMEDRKVYIGRVFHMGEPTESEGLDQEIRVLLLASGYRDPNNLTVNISTPYDDVKEVQITLRQDKVISATTFDASVFKQFQQRTRKVNTVMPDEPQRLTY